MILVTGGAGYIGSHVCIELLNAQYEIVVVDNFSNSKLESLERVKEITNRDFLVYQRDLTNQQGMEEIFSKHQIEAVIHFAGLKAVGESVEHPLKYYQNNIVGTLVLCEVMQKFGVKKMVFSSSATVYGISDKVPISEDSRLQPTSPYGRSKLMIEQILNDVYISDHSWSVSILRYFNPIGAHESGKIGENPHGVPNNLMPYLTEVAIGKREQLNIFGNDYRTHDGTAIRDYIHVMDLAKGHIKALQKIKDKTGVEAYNLGTGEGISVLDLVKSFERATNQIIPYIFTERRSGDIEQSFADPSKANKELHWTSERSIEVMCRDSWHWQINKSKEDSMIEAKRSKTRQNNGFLLYNLINELRRQK